MFPRPPASVDEMVRKADDLMYAVKADGGDALRIVLDGHDAPLPGVR